MSNEKQTRFTPGEWKADLEHYEVRSNALPNYAIASVDGTNKDEAIANCHLIAAAPQMYEWLEGVVEQADAQKKYGDQFCTLGNAQIEAIRQFLAVARGEVSRG